MISLIKKDIKLALLTKSTLFFLIIYIPLMLFMDFGDTKTVYIASVLTFTYMYLTVPFQYELKNKTHLLIQSLPIKKIDIVISRYTYLLLTFLFSTVFVTIYFKLLNALGFNIDIELSVDLFKQLLFTVLIAMSIFLPIHFIFEPKVGNFLGIFLYASIFSFLPSMDFLENKLSLIKNYGAFIPIAIALVFLLSMIISIFIYNRRNFS